jgi:replicative DNA helicase Mcm
MKEEKIDILDLKIGNKEEEEEIELKVIKKFEKYKKDEIIKTNWINAKIYFKQKFVLFVNDKDNKRYFEEKENNKDLKNLIIPEEIYINPNESAFRKTILTLYKKNKPLSRKELAEEIEEKQNYITREMNRGENKDYFSYSGRDGKNKLWMLSEKGKKYTEKIILKEIHKNKPFIEEKFKNNLEEYKIEIKKFYELYKKELGDQIKNNDDFLRINFENLLKFNKILIQMLEEMPEEILETLENCLNEWLQLIENKRQITFYNIPDSYKMNLGDIRTEHKNKLVVFNGIIITQTEVYPREVISKYECPSCGTIISVYQLEEKLREPKRCSCGRRGGFKKISCEDIDTQKMHFEEPQEEIDNRETQNIYGILEGALTKPNKDKYKNIGEKVKIIGIVKTKYKVLKNGGVSTDKTKYIKVIDIKSPDKEIDLNLDDKEIKRVKELSKKESPHLIISEDIFKNLYINNKIKEILLLQQFGGVRKRYKDQKIFRGDIHILLIGDPSTAKSDIMRFMRLLPRKGVYASGEGLSGAGLSGAVTKDEFLKRWVVRAGVLARANKGMAFIDEFDKLKEENRGSLHESLENQEVTINKVGVGKFKSQCAVLACANPINSKFEIGENYTKQLNLLDSLRSRFDFIIPFFDTPNKEKDKKICEKILNPIDDEVDFDFYKKYIIHSKTIEPKITKEAKEIIEKEYLNARKNTKDINTRTLNAIIRLSEAVARSRLSEIISVDDAKKSIELHKYCRKKLKVQGEFFSESNL